MNTGFGYYSRIFPAFRCKFQMVFILPVLAHPMHQHSTIETACEIKAAIFWSGEWMEYDRGAETVERVNEIERIREWERELQQKEALLQSENEQNGKETEKTRIASVEKHGNFVKTSHCHHAKQCIHRIHFQVGALWLGQ